MNVPIRLNQRRAFFTVVAAPFFSSLADNALLIAAFGMLMEQHAPLLPKIIGPGLFVLFAMTLIIVLGRTSILSFSLVKNVKSQAFWRRIRGQVNVRKIY